MNPERHIESAQIAEFHVKRCQGNYCPCYTEGVEDGKTEERLTIKEIASRLKRSSAICTDMDAGEVEDACDEILRLIDGDGSAT